MRIALAAVSYNLRGAEAATGLSMRTIQEAVALGDLVPNYKGRTPIFRAVDLDAWIESLPTDRTAA